MPELTGRNTSKTLRASSFGAPSDASFLLSSFMFRIGLALVTFEQVRPLGMMLADYCFFASILVLLPSFRSILRQAKGSGILPAGVLILSGAFLSLLSDSDLRNAAVPLVKLFILFGLFAPLAVIHSQNVRKNMLFLIAGISVNCAVTVLQAWVFPGIVDALSINPLTQDLGESEIRRFQGLTQFPVTLGLAAAVAVLLGLGLVLNERRKRVSWGLAWLVLICTAAALLSGSRTFLAALIPGLIVLALLQERRRQAIVHALVGVVVLWGALAYFVPTAISQFSDRLDDAGLVDYSRLAVAAQALIEISQKPILGWGISHFGEAGSLLLPEINDVQGAHVTLLQYWYGAGLLGAIGFLALFVIPTRRMLQVLRKKLPDDSTNAVRLILASYVAFFIIVSLGPYLYNRYLYIPLFAFAGFTANILGPVGRRSAVHQKVSKQQAVSGFGLREGRVNTEAF
jgi:O-antigen ligase